jgi:antirestriction protein ArdC
MGSYPKRARRDIYQEVTDKILTALERGVVPWHCPWGRYRGLPANLTSGKEYRGANTILLAMARRCIGYESPYWMTYKQAQERGGNVRKGESGELVIFWKWYDKQSGETRDDGTERKDRIPVLRHYVVFNVDQCDDIEPPPGEVESHEWDRIAACDGIAAGYADGPTITHAGDHCCYRPADDTVAMPRRDRFETGEAYYASLFHELTHSTGAEKRINRPLSFDRQSEGYAREELIAEMGAAMLCGVAGIDCATVENSAAYVDHWIGVLKGDHKLAVQAAAAAQKAADRILGRTWEE